jgi:hypothetical protein
MDPEPHKIAHSRCFCQKRARAVEETSLAAWIAMFDYESKGRVFESGIISVAATLGLALGRTLSVVQLALERNESHLGLAEHSFNLG